MSIEKDEKKEVGPGCTDISCCTPVGEGEGQEENKCALLSLSRLKTFIFIIVMLAAAGVAAMSILKKGSNKTSEEAAGKFDTDLASLNICGPSLDSLNRLNKEAADKDFVYVLLPGEGDQETEKVSGVIEKTSKVISENGTKVGHFTIKTDSDDYKNLVNSYGIDNFPAVLALGKGRGSAIITGEITQEKLLAAYIRASQPANCGPKAGSCCPK